MSLWLCMSYKILDYLSIFKRYANIWETKALWAITSNFYDSGEKQWHLGNLRPSKLQLNNLYKSEFQVMYLGQDSFYCWGTFCKTAFWEYHPTPPQNEKHAYRGDPTSRVLSLFTKYVQSFVADTSHSASWHFQTLWFLNIEKEVRFSSF